MDYDQLHQQVRSHYGALSPQLKRIAAFVLEQSHEAALATVAEIAGRLDVQPSAVIRFSKAVGFNGFAEIQDILLMRLRQSLPSYRERIERAGAAASSSRSLLEMHAEEDMQALRALQSGELGADVDRAAAVLARAQFVYLVATGRAMPVASYLAYALGRLEKRTLLVDSTNPTLAQQAQLATGRDAVVATSFHPYNPNTVALAKAVVSAGVPMVPITDSIVSPLASMPGPHLVYSETGSQPLRSLTVPMCIARTLVVSTGAHMQKRRKA